MLRLYMALFLALATLPVFSAEEPDIRQLMTAEEFAASGLSRLSDDEFDVVNRWLMRFTGQVEDEVISASPSVEEIRGDIINSRIDGQFTGWNGPTLFPLKNGQVWETNSTRRYSYSATDPEVEITKNWLGTYRMRVVDTGKYIYVKRVQ
ncbi:MAG: hypothetical protein DHS20C12_02080 [Pseudohongiella sp.]|nr:MAG: hypothetical protein DHS20C12_02080 [Pseudohongiella sp.]